MPTSRKFTNESLLIHGSGARGSGARNSGTTSSKQGGARGPKERPPQPPKR